MLLIWLEKYSYVDGMAFNSQVAQGLEWEVDGMVEVGCYNTCVTFILGARAKHNWLST